MKIQFTAFPRTVQGTGASRRLRGGGKVPGIVYGADKAAQAIELDHHALFRHLRMEAFHASILEMTLDNTQQQVLLRDVQMHPFKQQVLHIDFQRVDPAKKIHMSVPLHFLNTESAPGVKLGGGKVSHIFNELEISCLPKDLPEFINVDLGKLELGDSVHVGDVQLPAGVEITAKLRKENPPIAVVQVPKEVAVEEVVAAPTTEITGQGPEVAAGAEGGEKKDDKKEAAKKE